MTLWILLTWLGVGALAGFSVCKIKGGSSPYGGIGDIVLGLIGGVIGGYHLMLTGLDATTVSGFFGTVIMAGLGGYLLARSVRFIEKKPAKEQSTCSPIDNEVFNHLANMQKNEYSNRSDTNH